MELFLNGKPTEKMTELGNLPSVTKKQKRLSTIVSIIVSISVSVISGLLMAKMMWKRCKNKEDYATSVLRKQSPSYLRALNSQCICCREMKS